MNRLLKAVGIACVTTIALIAVFAVGGAIYHQLMPVRAEASTLEKVTNAAHDEGETRGDVVQNFSDLKTSLDSMQNKLEGGDVAGAQSDGDKLRDQAAELTEVCARWKSDLARLDTDGRALFSEWETLINGIGDVQQRLREGERFAKAKNRFEQHLDEARAAVAQTDEALHFFGDVEKVIQSVDYATSADRLSGGALTLTASATVRTRDFRSAADKVLAAMQQIKDVALT